eukprot:SAG31_NODE_9454_length_1275_cov_0.818878_1_plen_52_part_10
MACLLILRTCVCLYALMGVAHGTSLQWDMLGPVILRVFRLWYPGGATGTLSL